MKQNLSGADHCVERSEDPHHCLEHRHFRTTSVPYGHMCAHHCPSLLLVNPMFCLEKMSLESLGFIIWLNMFLNSLNNIFKLGASFSPDKNKMYLREKLSSAHKNKIPRMNEAIEEV